MGKKTILACLFAIQSCMLAHNGTIISVGIPKSGNHMLLKCLGLIARKSYSWSRNLAMMYVPPNHISRGILSSHALFIDQNVKAARSGKNVKGFFIYRDPRDQVVSMAHFAKKWRKNRDKSLENLITEIIMDGSSVYGPNFLRAPEIKEIKGVNDFYYLYLPWMNEPYMFVTTFEKLIGPQGGGDKETQLTEIQLMGQYIDIDITREQAETISKKMWGGTLTFRKGQIGSWKNHFTPEHKKLFKKVAGQLLIDLEYEQDLNW